MTDSEIKLSLKIKSAVKEWFETNNRVSKVPEKELMPLFIQKGIFGKDHQDGFPIRELLRKLDEEKMLNLIPQAFADRKVKNTQWYFINQQK